MECPKCNPTANHLDTFTVGATYRCTKCEYDFTVTGFTANRKLPEDSRIQRILDDVDQGLVEVEHIVLDEQDLPSDTTIWKHQK